MVIVECPNGHRASKNLIFPPDPEEAVLFSYRSGARNPWPFDWSLNA